MKTISRHALAGKNLRKELKVLFPDQKFSIITESYSGGSSLRVHWVDGPEERTIGALLSKYVYGEFDGMNDIYNYRDQDETIGSVKFAFAYRNRN